MTTLKDYIEKVEAQNAEMRDIRAEVKRIFNAAEEEGFNKKIMKAVIKLRAIPEDKRKEVETLIDAYMNQLEKKSP